MRIFISYRRSDAGGYAGRIYDRLTNRFGTAAVFMDVTGVPPGENFMRTIEARIAESAVLLAVIGEDWLGPDGTARRRIDSTNDPVRLEIETALCREVRIIPVIVGRARIPDEADLPATIRPIATLNAVRITNDMFDDCIERLLRALDALAGRPKRVKNARGSRPFLVAFVVATIGTAFTVWFFDSRPETSVVQFSPGDILFVFVTWLVVSAGIAFGLRKARIGRRAD